MELFGAPVATLTVADLSPQDIADVAWLERRA